MLNIVQLKKGNFESQRTLLLEVKGLREDEWKGAKWASYNIVHSFDKKIKSQNQFIVTTFFIT